ncbi:ATP-binding protein [Acidovorax sp. NCPPB 3576]|uniref:ATP-binding protein n=1 Tax=Acidovorax sp. NCPPB 3576 TaxID=2940488 RepID=UPI00234A0C19|nr:ATP-binding protein [Acidovorax sp. NCPPB 3576]WCM90617.1 ATP-binding protein [Acidovorax sp. NCPPB 3576]
MQSHQEINLRSLALREAALTPGEDRDRLYEEHPLVLNAICIPTGPVQEAYDIVRQVLVHRDPGTCLTADFRIGKTTAIHAITRQLSRTTPDVPFGFVIVKGHDKPTERNFFTDILLDFKHRAATSGTTTDRRTRVLSTMLSQAMQKKSTRYLLLVDEGQNWGESEFTFLRDLTNDCQERNLAVITVIFGHPALKQIRAHLVGKARMDLVARFLLTPRVFRGIQDKEDFLATFRAHDDAGLLEFPPHSGICYSEFFFPQAWRAGWRLEHEGDQAWDAFCLVSSDFGRHEKNIGMNWIAGAIRNFFFSQAESDSPGYMASRNVWRDAVDASGYAASLVV